MSQFATGVVVITGNASGELIGFAAQSFASLSLDPPLVLFCPQKTSTSWPKIRKLSQFTINTLSESQHEVSDGFAMPGEVPQIHWHTLPNSNHPILDNSISTLLCSVDSETPAGDHSIVVASVESVHVHDDTQSPLLFFRGQYGKFKFA